MNKQIAIAQREAMRWAYIVWCVGKGVAPGEGHPKNDELCNEKCEKCCFEYICGNENSNAYSKAFQRGDFKQAKLYAESILELWDNEKREMIKVLKPDSDNEDKENGWK